MVYPDINIMKSAQEIKAVLNNHKQKLYHDYPIQSLAIFGSYAREEQNEQSDLDVLVEFNDKIGIRFIDLADEIESVVGIHVDLVSKNGVKEKYLKAIEPELIYV